MAAATPPTFSGATASTYVLAAADAGKKIKVEVEFTDDADNDEGPLASAAYPATGTVVATTTNAAPVFGDGAGTTRTFAETPGSTVATSGSPVGQPGGGVGRRQRSARVQP